MGKLTRLPEYRRVKFLRPDGDQTRQKIMRYVRWYWDEFDIGPCFREIMESCGLKTTSAVSYEVDKLIKMGYLANTPGKARSLRPTDMRIDFDEPVE